MSLETDAGLRAEFERRLHHQMKMYNAHGDVCTEEKCVTGTFISRAIADSYTTLNGLGHNREANEIIAQYNHSEAGQ